MGHVDSAVALSEVVHVVTSQNALSTRVDRRIRAALVVGAHSLAVLACQVGL